MATEIRESMIGRKLTGAQKMSAINKLMGNKNISKQQGTSRVLYDTLPLIGGTLPVIVFFSTVSTRQFPMANINQNKLQVGESLAVQRVFFSIVNTLTADATNATVTVVEPISTLAGALIGLYAAQWSLKIDTTTVIKPVPLSSQIPAFNRLARHTAHENFVLDNPIIIPTDINFEVPLQLPTFTTPVVANNTVQMRCSLEGIGTLLSPKTQF